MKEEKIGTEEGWDRENNEENNEEGKIIRKEVENEKKTLQKKWVERTRLADTLAKL